MLFTELPFLDRFDAAASAGFEGVEFLFPYEYETDDLAARLKAKTLKRLAFVVSAELVAFGIAHVGTVEWRLSFAAHAWRAFVFATVRERRGVERFDCGA